MQSNINRRTFLKKASILGGITLTLPLFTNSQCTKNKLKILVLGGTYFVGPAIVQSLQSAGHQVTLFNRGQTNPHLFPKVSKIKGDREKGHQGYENLVKTLHQWDVVIDVWPQKPQLVEEAITVLKDRTQHYIFISSIAAYKDFAKANIKEDYPLRVGTTYEKDNYNLNKVLCEKIITQHFPENHTIVRPGAIIGPRDPGPFPHYVIQRIISEKQILAPASNAPVQFIDVKDVAQFITLCAEKGLSGPFNLVGPEKQLSYKDFLLMIKQTLKSPVEIHWMDADFLVKEMKLTPFIDIPFWIPLKDDPDPGLYQISNAKALQNGLQLTAFSQSVEMAHRSLLAKHSTAENYIRGISSDREAEVIALWKQRAN